MNSKLTLALVTLFAPLGCSTYIGPAGFAVAAFGSAYTHHESFSDPPKATAAEEGGDGLKSWTTVALRTFGTVDIEATVDMGSERIALTGDGMSKNMAGVIGEDVAAKIGLIVACSLQPAQPACLGIGGLRTDAASGAGVVLEEPGRLRGSPETPEADENDPTSLPSTE